MHAEYHWFLVYWMRIWFAGSAVETVVVILWLEFVFVFSLVDASRFVLVSWYFDIWNLFLLVLHLNVAFAVRFERIAPTASDAVGDVMVWIAIRWEKCLLGFPRNPLFVFWDTCLFSLLRMMIYQQSHEILSSVLEQKDHWEKLMSDGGR